MSTPVEQPLGALEGSYHAELVRGGIVRRGLALIVDFLVVEVLIQFFATIAFPLSGSILIDSNSLYTFCEPAKSRPIGIDVPAEFQKGSESVCTKSLLGWPTARFYIVSRQDTATHVTTSMTYAIGSHGDKVAVFDLSILQAIVLALMRWLLERRGWRSLGRMWLSLQVRPRGLQKASANSRSALARRYTLFAVPFLPMLAINIGVFAVQRLGKTVEGDTLSVLFGLGMLAWTIAFFAAFGAVWRYRDAFYDAAAGTTVICLVDGKAEVASEIGWQERGKDAALTSAMKKQIFTKRVPKMSCTLAIILAATFVFELVRSGATQGMNVDGETLVSLGAMDGELVRQVGQWYRLLTAIALHVNAAHLLGNVVVLLAAGWMLEGLIGPAWFLATFLLGGLGASTASIMWNEPTSLAVGASGATSAIVAAGFVASFRLADGEDRLWLRAFCVACLFASLEASGRFGLGSIDRVDHVAGCLAGAAIGLVMLMLGNRGEVRPSGGRAALGAAFLVTATLFVSVPLAGFGGVPLQVLLVPSSKQPQSDAEWISRSAELVLQYPADPRGHLARAVAVGYDAVEREAEMTRAIAARKRLAPADGAKAEQETYLMVAKARQMAGDWAAAGTLFTRAISAAAPSPPEVFSLRADTEVELGSFDAAVLDLKRLLGLSPNKARIDLRIAAILFAEDDVKGAIAENDDALILAPQDALVLRQRGWLEFFNQEREKAITNLGNVSAMNPSDAYAALWLDIVSMRAGRGASLQKVSAKLDMTIWPSPVIQLYRGEIGVAALMAASADADPRKQSGQRCEALFYTGEWQILLHDLDEAQRNLKEAVATCPKSFDEWAAAQAELRGEAGLHFE